MERKKKELLSVEVSMLGHLSIHTPYGEFLESDGRSKKVMILIGILIANRKHPISVDMLIENIWGEQERNDPLNVLKNLVYRARNILKPLSENDQFSMIAYRNGSYYWNPETNMIVDTEIFEEKVRDSQEFGISSKRKLKFLLEALQMYPRGFLEQFTYNDWVGEKNAYYNALYIDTALNASLIFEKENRFEEVIAVCEEAARRYALDERLHEMLLRAYVATRRFSKALLHYNYITKLFYSELGVSLSNQVKMLYEDIVKSVSTIEMDLNGICNNLDEMNEVAAAYYCDYESFKNIYRLQARVIERTGQSICVVLLTLMGQDGQKITDGKKYKQYMSQLKKIILMALRRGDVISQFSGTQFVLMLSMTDEQNAGKVTERICRKFRELHLDGDMKIKVNIRSLMEKNKR